ncbi:MAG: MBL fold metallo-hydrolase [Candidatus Hydrogenedentales bacterium]|jgi:glyoxylase-like metal-dependent hydrolase (beta-lactamase superfamily II)
MTYWNPNPDIIPIALPTPFIVGPVNCFLVKGTPLTLVDTGLQTDESYLALTTRLGELGYSIRDIEAVILTHAHVDHIGLLARVVAESGAKTFAHVSTANQLEHFEENESRTQSFIMETLREFGTPEEIVLRTAEARDTFRGMAAGVSVDHRMKHGETVLNYTVCYAPGHSSSDTLFVDEKRRLAFSGDHVLKRISPNPLMRRPRKDQPRAKSLVEYQVSLRRTLELDLEVCYPGHGDPIAEHTKVIDSLLERQERRTEKIQGILLEGGSMTPHQVCEAIFPGIDAQYYYLGMSLAIGHLEVLEERGQAYSESRDGILHYTLASTKAGSI